MEDGVSTIDEFLVNPPVISQEMVDDTTNSAIEYVDDTLIESIWMDLEGHFAQEEIRKVAVEVATKYQGANITQFIPLFIRRETGERLKGL